MVILADEILQVAGLAGFETMASLPVSEQPDFAAVDQP